MRLNKKRAFSIIEAMIALTVISILIASSAHFLSKKSTNVAVAGVDASHGRFECWRGKDGKVRQALYVGDKLVGKIEEVDECKFEPPTDAVKLNVLAVGAGGAGGGLKNDFIDSYKEFNEKGTLDIRKGTVFPKDKNPKKITKKLGSTTQSADYENSQDWFSWDILNRSKNSKAFDAVSAACGTGGGDGGSLTINDKNMDCWDDCYKSIFSTSSSANCSDWGTMNCPYKVITQYEGEAIDSSTDCCSDKLRCVIGEETTETGKLYTCTWDEISYQADLNCPKKCKCSDTYCNPAYYSCSDGSNWTNSAGRITYSAVSYNCLSSSRTKKTCESDGFGCNGISTHNRLDKTYSVTLQGSSGGASPGCAYIKTNITGKTKLSYSCSGSGANGRSQTVEAAKTTDNQFTNTLTDGQNGKSCTMTAGSSKGRIIGGQGGLQYCQAQIRYDLHSDQKNIFYELSSGDARIVEEAIDKTSVLYDYREDIKRGVFYSVDYEGSSLPEYAAIEYSNTTTITDTDSSQTNLVNSGCKYICKKAPTFTDNGANGKVAAGIKCTSGSLLTGDAKGGYCYDGIYNHLYSWSEPRASKYLGYGESGQPGQFIQTTIETKNAITITPGVGGIWKDDSWKNSTGRAPSGSDTVIKYGISSLVAKGGQGGISGLTTERFELCYPEEASESYSGKVAECVRMNKNDKNTDEIVASLSIPSQFSEIIGAISKELKEMIDNEVIKLGDGGKGGGSKSPLNIVGGLRSVKNISAHKNYTGDLYVFKEEAKVNGKSCKGSIKENTTCISNLETTYNCEDMKDDNTKACLNSGIFTYYTSNNTKATKTISATQTDNAIGEQCLKDGGTQDECAIKQIQCRIEAESVFEKCNSLKEQKALECYTASTSGDTCDYKNQYMQTSASDLQGGHGGVVITW